MEEIIRAKLRVKELYMSAPIKEKGDLAAAVWGEKLPFTLRDDELLISEEDPEEDAVYSHENDTPEEVDYTGKGLKMTGTFIQAERDQLKVLMGGSASDGKYEHPTSKLQLEKAFKIVCRDGEVIIPRASGFVNMSLSLGKGGVSRFPFSFTLKRASADWDCDIIF